LVELADLRTKKSKNGRIIKKPHQIIKKHLKTKIDFKFSLVFRKVFSFYFGRKTLSGSCEKFRNVILFAYYIKFGPQTFDCYIYFVLNICFQFHLLEFYFYIKFGPHFYNCYLLFPYHFVIDIFYLTNLVVIVFVVTYFI
jgi:hypothetical protein